MDKERLVQVMLLRQGSVALGDWLIQQATLPRDQSGSREANVTVLCSVDCVKGVLKDVCDSNTLILYCCAVCFVSSFQSHVLRLFYMVTAWATISRKKDCQAKHSNHTNRGNEDCRTKLKNNYRCTGNGDRKYILLV